MKKSPLPVDLRGSKTSLLKFTNYNCTSFLFLKKQDGQRRLTEVAEDTVIRVTAGQERLVRQQQQLQSNYEDVQRSISFSLRGNVRALNHEKVLIDNGRRQLKEMAKTVKEKLGKDMYNVGRFICHLYQKRKIWVNPLESSQSEHMNVHRLPAADVLRGARDWLV